jgi:hypothetical protein
MVYPKYCFKDKFPRWYIKLMQIMILLTLLQIPVIYW